MAATTQHAAIATATLGDNTIAAAVAGKRIVLVGYVITNSVATAQSIQWKSGAATDLSGVIGLSSAIGGGISVHGTEQNPVLVGARGDALVLELTAATAVAGHVAFKYE